MPAGTRADQLLGLTLTALPHSIVYPITNSSANLHWNFSSRKALLDFSLSINFVLTQQVSLSINSPPSFNHNSTFQGLFSSQVRRRCSSRHCVFVLGTTRLRFSAQWFEMHDMFSMVTDLPAHPSNSIIFKHPGRSLDSIDPCVVSRYILDSAFLSTISFCK